MSKRSCIECGEPIPDGWPAWHTSEGYWLCYTKSECEALKVLRARLAESAALEVKQ